MRVGVGVRVGVRASHSSTCSTDDGKNSSLWLVREAPISTEWPLGSFLLDANSTWNDGWLRGLVRLRARTRMTTKPVPARFCSHMVNRCWWLGAEVEPGRCL